VTAGVGLGQNRAMLFLVEPETRETLRGIAAVGPDSAEEADRIWRSIEEEAPDLETLYQAGLHLASGAPGKLDRRVRSMEVPAGGDSPIGLALRGGHTVRAEGSDSLDGLLHVPTGLAAPLRGRTSVQGVLYADNRFTGRVPDPIESRVFSMVADHAGQAIEHARRFERVARQARTDALTGLGHHGALQEALAQAVKRALDGQEPLGLAMIDLDDFKAVNDIHGHLAGDALLAGLSARMRAELRLRDQVYRYGGEEFTVIMPAADIGQAVTVAERIRAAVAEQPFSGGGGLSLRATCSIGVACLGQRTDAQTLLDAADRALLRAKANGKNCVVSD